MKSRALAPPRAVAPPSTARRITQQGSLGYALVALAVVLAAPRGPTSYATAILAALGSRLLRTRRRAELGGALCVVALIETAIGRVSPDQLVPATVIFAATSVSWIRWHRSGGDSFPVATCFLLVTSAYTVVVIATSPPLVALSTPITHADRAAGLWLTAAFATMVAAFAAIGPRRWQAPIIHLQLGTPAATAILLLSFGTELGLLATDLSPRLGLLGNLPSVLRFLLVGFIVSQGATAKIKPRAAITLLTVAIVGDILIGLGTLQLYNAVGAGLTAFFARMRRVGQVPILIITGALLVLIPLNSAKTAARERITDGESISPLPVAAELIQLAAGRSFRSSTAIDESGERFSYPVADLPGWALREIPDQQPYADKSTYRFLPLVALPRIIFPFKPKASFANEFGRAYGLLGPTDTRTSPNLPMATEAYVNFGWAGVLGVGALLGLLLSALGKLFGSRSPANMAFGSLTGVIVARGVESDSIQAIGGLMLVLPLYVLLRLVGRR